MTTLLCPKLRGWACVTAALSVLAVSGCSDYESMPTTPTQSPAPSPSTPTGAPALTGVGIEPGGAGLQHATDFAFQPLGETGASPTFAWTFGEGGTSSAGANVRYVYAQAGTFTVRVEARNGAGSSAATRTVDVRSLAGAWSGTVTGHTNLPAGQAQPVRTFELTLEQTPSRALGPVTGEWTDNAGCRQRTMLGQVSHPRDIVISLESFFCNNTDFTLTGTMDASGTVVEGRCVNGGPDCVFRMTRR